MSVGYQEVLIILAIMLLLFGPSQLPKLGRSLGDTIREFRGIRKSLADDDAE